jgi:hypothetical protein
MPIQRAQPAPNRRYQLWRVRYRRAGLSPSTTTRVRVFHAEAHARRLVARVEADGGTAELAHASVPIVWQVDS